MKKSLFFFFLIALSIINFTTSKNTFAIEEEWALSAGPTTTIQIDPTWYAVGIQTSVYYGLTDAFSIGTALNLNHLIKSKKYKNKFYATLSIDAQYAFDILVFVPFLAIKFQTLFAHKPIFYKGKWALGIALAAGLKYRFSRQFSITLEPQYNILFTDLPKNKNIWTIAIFFTYYFDQF